MDPEDGEPNAEDTDLETSDENQDPHLGEEPEGGDGPEGEPDAPQEGDPQELEPPQRSSRANDAIRRARESAQEAKRQAETDRAERDNIRRELEQLRRQVTAPPPDPMAAQREQERLAMMAPHELMQHYQETSRRERQQELAQLRMEMQEQNDRSSFAAIKAREPMAAKYEAEVEKLVASERAAGRVVSRETAYTFALGQAMRTKGPAQIAAQRKAAGARVDSQRTRPSSQSGAPREGRPSGDDLASLKARLKDVII